MSDNRAQHADTVACSMCGGKSIPGTCTHCGYVYKSGFCVRVGRWALDPCYRCGRQPEPNEHCQLDLIAQTVLCRYCHLEDQRKFAEALGRWADKIERQIDGGGE